MKKTLFILIGLILVGSASYSALRNDPVVVNETENTGYENFNSAILGIEFEYRKGADGYVLEEVKSAEKNYALISSLVLIQEKELQEELPVGGEWPPAIAVLVYNNPENQTPQAWADAHTESNINIKTSDIMETIIGGKPAIRYMADGLYASEIAVVGSGDKIYLIFGQFIDQESQLRRDFEPLLQSIKFL